MRGKQFGQVKGRGDAYPQGVVEFLIAALVKALHQRQGVVDQKIHMPIIGKDLLSKIFQDRLFCQITHVVIIGQQINHTDMGPFLPKGICNGLSDSLGAAGHDSYFSGKHFSLLR